MVKFDPSDSMYEIREIAVYLLSFDYGDCLIGLCSRADRRRC